MEQQSAAVAHQATVRYTDHNKIVTDVGGLLRMTEQAWGAASPITLPSGAPLVMDACLMASAETIGSFTSDGYMVRPDGTPFNDVNDGNTTTGVAVAGTTSSTVDQLLINKAFLLPAHGACTITNLAGRLIVSSYGSGGGAGGGVVDKAEILLIKVAADGTVTTLDTTTITAGLPGNSGTTGNVKREPVFSTDYDAGYAIAATERIGVRIKVYGHSSANTYLGSVGLNTDYFAYQGSSYYTPQNVARFSRLAFTFD